MEARSRARLASRSFPVPYWDIFMTDILAAADLGHPLSRVPPTWRTLESRGRIANLVTARVANRSRQDIIFPTLTHYVHIYILGSLDTSMEENRQSTISNPLSHRDRFGHAKVRKRCTCACSFFSAYLKASLTRAPGASIATSARVINSPVRVFLLNYRRAIDIAC